MLGEQRGDWLEDVLEGDEVFVEQAALLHQVQAGGQTRQPADSKENTQSSTQLQSGNTHWKVYYNLNFVLQTPNIPILPKYGVFLYRKFNSDSSCFCIWPLCIYILALCSQMPWWRAARINIAQHQHKPS